MNDILSCTWMLKTLDIRYKIDSTKCLTTHTKHDSFFFVSQQAHEYRNPLLMVAKAIQELPFFCWNCCLTNCCWTFFSPPKLSLMGFSSALFAFHKLCLCLDKCWLHMQKWSVFFSDYWYLSIRHILALSCFCMLSFMQEDQWVGRDNGLGNRC